MRARFAAGPLVAGSLLVLLPCVRGHAARGEAYALVNGRVVPVSGPVLDKGTVVMRDGLIEAVGAAVTVPADARVIDVKGLTVTPGLVDGFVSRKLPLLVTVNFDPPRAAALFGTPDDEKERRHIEEAEKNPAELHKAGVVFALVSGHAPDFLAGVRKAIERGLPADVALRAITLAPAEVLGVADRLGSLEAGKIADVVVWSGEPLTKDAKPKMVFVDGQLYEPEDKPEPRRDEASPSPSPRAASPAPEVQP